MRFPKLTKGDFVYIVWSDTHNQKDNSWLTITEYENWCKNGVQVQSIGFFMKQDKDFIRIVGDIEGDIEGETDDTHICRQTTIGKGLIKEIRILHGRQI
jgi:hypothetical protein